jgi:hypothetical protein
MGFLDKVKEQAAVATAVAKDAAQKGQAKLDDIQAKRAADAMLRDLGAAFYAQRTGRATPSSEADIDRLVAALGQHEADHGPLSLSPEAPTDGQGPSAAAPPPGGSSGSPPPSPSGQTP